jgi:hypothetical protein
MRNLTQTRPSSIWVFREKQEAPSGLSTSARSILAYPSLFSYRSGASRSTQRTVPLKENSRGRAFLLAASTRTATTVEVGTVCVGDLPNTRKVATPYEQRGYADGMHGPSRAFLPAALTSSATSMAVPRPILGRGMGFASGPRAAGDAGKKGDGLSV